MPDFDSAVWSFGKRLKRLEQDVAALAGEAAALIERVVAEREEMRRAAAVLEQKRERLRARVTELERSCEGGRHVGGE